MEQIMGTALLMMEGAQITLEIFCVTLLLSLPLGLLVALCRISKLGPLRLLMEFYIWLMRGTPLMLQLLFVYFALPMIGIRLPDIAAALLAFCCRPFIEKVRYREEVQGHIWEIDCFRGENEGLILAEIELRREDEPFVRPAWLGEEVSGDPRYYNSCLAENPYRAWGKS